MLRAVLLDLGETLVHLDRPWEEVFGANITSLHSYLKEQGLNLDFETFAKVFLSVFEQSSATADFYKIEIPIQDIMFKVLRKLRFRDLSDDLTQRTIAEFYAPELEAWQPYPDTLPTLSALKKYGLELGLISNAKSDWAVHSILNRNRIQDFFKVVITSAELGIRKPRVEIFERALKSLNMRPEESAFLGDSLNADVIGAKMVGMRSIHIRRGSPTGDFVHPDATVTSLSEALRQITDWRVAQ